MANLWESLEPSDPVAAEIHTPTKQLQNQQQRCDTPKSTKKRTRLHQLYANGNIIAKGHVLQDATTVHGTAINTETHVVVEVTSVFDSD